MLKDMKTLMDIEEPMTNGHGHGDLYRTLAMTMKSPSKQIRHEAMHKVNTWQPDIDRCPMGPVSPKHGELAESDWKHDEILNSYKMDTHTQVECVWMCK